MPGMTGLELATELEGRGVAIPTLLITGASNAAVRAEAASSGIKMVMQKPMSHHQLLRSSRRCVERQTPSPGCDSGPAWPINRPNSRACEGEQ